MSIDTVNDLPRRNQYTAVAAQTEFDYSFPIFTDADLTVYVDDDLQALDTDYTVAGEGDDAGGTVTFVSPMAGGEVVTIYSELEIERSTDFQQNGPWNSTAINDDLDKLTLICRELKDQIQRCLRIDMREGVASSDIALSPLSSWLGKYLYINSSGEPEPAAGVSSVTMTQSNIAALLNPATLREQAAPVTPTNFYRGSEAYDVRRYGAVGDGITDDSAAIQNALLVGGDLYFPKGYTFYVPNISQYTVASDLRMFGGGTLKGASGKYLLKPAGGDIRLEGMTFDTFAGIIESDTADTGTTDSLIVSFCEFNNMSALTIDHERPLNCAIITGNRFNTVYGESVRIGLNSFASQDNWKKIGIHNNRWVTVTSSGTDAACGAIVYGKEVVISGNTVESVNASAGSGEAWGFYTKARKKVIVDNVIVSIVGAGAVATIVGINVKGSQRGDTAAPQGFNSVIANNYVEAAGGYGIRAQCDEILIANNVIEEPGDSAISVDATGNNVLVIGNKGYVATAGSKVGIRCAWNGNNVMLHDNLMKGFADCILVAVGAAETLTDLSMQGNILVADAAAGNAVRLSVNASGTLTYCKIRNNPTVSGFKGLQMPAAGTTTGLVIEGNDLRGSTTKINGSIPAGTRIKDNLGYVSRKSGISAAIATGATITHGCGATPGVVTVTAAESGPTDIYVTAVGATTFAVNFGGGGSKTFYWQAITPEEYA